MYNIAISFARNVIRAHGLYKVKCVLVKCFTDPVIAKVILLGVKKTKTRKKIKEHHNYEEKYLNPSMHPEQYCFVAMHNIAAEKRVNTKT